MRSGTLRSGTDERNASRQRSAFAVGEIESEGANHCGCCANLDYVERSSSGGGRRRRRFVAAAPVRMAWKAAGPADQNSRNTNRPRRLREKATPPRSVGSKKCGRKGVCQQRRAAAKNRAGAPSSFRLRPGARERRFRGRVLRQARSECSEMARCQRAKCEKLTPSVEGARWVLAIDARAASAAWRRCAQTSAASRDPPPPPPGCCGPSAFSSRLSGVSPPAAVYLYRQRPQRRPQRQPRSRC